MLGDGANANNFSQKYAQESLLHELTGDVELVSRWLMDVWVETNIVDPLQYLQIETKSFVQLLHKSNRQYDTSTVYAFLWRIAFQRFKFGKFVDTGSCTHYYIFIRRGRFDDIGSCIYLLNELQLFTRRKKHAQASCF